MGKSFKEKVLNNKFVKILLKVSIETFFVVFLFFLIVLAVFYVISSYQDILKKFGIYVEDNCKVEEGRLVCSFIHITDKKEFDVKLENINGEFNFYNFLKFKPIVNLKVDKLTGKYINDLTAPPSESFKFIFPLYLFTSYVNLDLKDGNFFVENVEKGLNLDIKNISLYNNQNLVYLKSQPALILIKDSSRYNLTLTSIGSYQLKILPKKMVVENVKLSYDSIYLDVKNISLFENKVINLSASLNTPSYSYNNINLSGLRADLNLKVKKDTDLKFNGFLTQLNYQNTKLLNSKFKGEINFKEGKLDGEAQVNIESLLSEGIELKDLSLFTDIKDKDGLVLKGRYDLKLATGDFEYIDKIKKLNLEADIPSIKKVLSVLPVKKDEILDSLDGKLTLSADYFIDKGFSDIQVNSKNFTVLGLNYDSLSGKVNISLKDYFIDADLKGLSKNQTISVKGRLKNFHDLKNLSYDFNLNTTNFILENLSYLKDIPIKANLNASGRIYGDSSNLHIKLSGNAQTFSYEDINLKNLTYDFSFENDLIKVNANSGEALKSNLTYDLKNEKLNLTLNVNRQFDLTPIYPFLLKHSKEVFERVLPKTAEGSIYITSVKKDWNVDLNLNYYQAYLKDIENSIEGNLSGKLNEKDINLTVNFNKDNLTFKNYTLKKIIGNVNLLNKNLKFSLKGEGLEGYKRFNLSASGSYNLDKEIFNLSVLSNLENENLQLKADLSAEGSLNDYKGKLSTIIKNQKQVNLIYDFKGNKDRLVAYGKDVKISHKDLNFNMGESILTVNFNKQDIQKSSAVAVLKNILVKEKEITLFNFSDLKINYLDKKIFTDKQVFTGTFKGVVEKFLFDLENNLLEIAVSGEMDKNYVAQIIQYVNLDGRVKFVMAYKGKPEDILEKASFKLYGDNIRVRTPYTLNVISFDKFDITLKDNLLIDIKGSTRSYYGDSSITITGKYNLKKREGNISIFSELLPVKYENIYNGVVSTNTDIKLVQDKVYINSNLLTTGKAKVEPEYFNKEAGSKPEFLKNINLNLKVSTLSPIFMEGSWGRAYGEGRFDVKGTADKPIVNGNFRISYGKVDFLKNKYNIDFIDVKLTDSKTYVNGKLSTNVAGIYIYVNVSGPADNLKYDFFSTPPKSKDEILSLLLIKKTPEQLASSGLFSVVGNVAKLLVPFKASGEEEEGLFGTGFNVNVLPTYNPVQGITFSVYVQKYLTRKIYLGFSKPLSTTTIINQYGFYEGGYRLTERSSFVLRLYDNKAKSVDLTFTLPFDF
ncbi:conserved hypothetical protein [Sulfurihydrogenibium azorense Az-Fu1]|uniref:Translocation and assembly module TamB C-terminal domain-containing protein n=1 Tax=Sulfurihydrogenibium azorense (strain DSM 15241 / OCM 825 / Az-Fu1) TaxID=204536 RepID=C1DVQ0_SULAA|nr:translocation/assembly module TamB domain-containing protein [Sulfurihydrogenibium azorense]ACN98670.1 conserved hypothetical protein [Sulfurihydrogenibium azorense Az-Fu1]